MKHYPPLWLSYHCTPTRHFLGKLSSSSVSVFGLVGLSHWTLTCTTVIQSSATPHLLIVSLTGELRITCVECLGSKTLTSVEYCISGKPWSFSEKETNSSKRFVSQEMSMLLLWTFATVIFEYLLGDFLTLDKHWTEKKKFLRTH